MKGKHLFGVGRERNPMSKRLYTENPEQKGSLKTGGRENKAEVKTTNMKKYKNKNKRNRKD